MHHYISPYLLRPLRTYEGVVKELKERRGLRADEYNRNANVASGDMECLLTQGEQR